MRVLITGGARFLGSHISDLLLQQGLEIIGVDNSITCRPENIAHLIGHDRFTFIKHPVFCSDTSAIPAYTRFSLHA